MAKEKAEIQEKKVPEPMHTYKETAIHPETGEEYTYTVSVYAPEPNPNEGLNPAYAYGGG
ncbi:hypothetical protein NVP2275O_187 [Vibrio phage 2.275.O._10N.286.54.E11]|nr:hypothetical protein NVP2275O_187 [Vibrio phage 2.275.O._10N.286.54.E11]